MEDNIFEQECNGCGAKFRIQYQDNGSYKYIDEPCECESDFSPVDDNPSIS